MTWILMKTNQCCCGRFKELNEPVVTNNIRHEPFGPEGAFCGQKEHHDIRDLLKENEKLKKENAKLKAIIGEKDGG